MAGIAKLAERLTLTPLIDLGRDAQLRILDIRNQPGVRNNMYTSHEITEDEHFRWIEGLRSASHTRFFAVLDGDQIVGGVSLNAIDTPNRRADWAFYLDESRQGRGLGAALEFRFLDYVFIGNNFKKLNCEVLAFNTAVIALHRKFGFQEEGVRRKHIRRDGEAIDAHLLGITAGEWYKRRVELEDGRKTKVRDTAYYLGIIDDIERARTSNNANWMDLLRLSFQKAPREAAAIVAEIYKQDQAISDLAKKLTSQ